MCVILGILSDVLTDFMHGKICNYDKVATDLRCNWFLPSRLRTDRRTCVDLFGYTWRRYDTDSSHTDRQLMNKTKH